MDRLIDEVVKDVWAQDLANHISAASFEAHDFLKEGKSWAHLWWKRSDALRCCDLGGVNGILDVVGKEHQVFHEVGVVILPEDCEHTSDEMGTIEYNFFLASNHTVQECIIVNILERMQGHQRENQRKMMKIARQGIHFCLRLDKTHKF